MRYRDLGRDRDQQTWSFEELEGILALLGYEPLGVLGVDDPPSMEDQARGDMHDDDLDWLNTKGNFNDQVFWHPELHIFAEVSGWLDDQPILTLRTDFEDGAILRSRTLYRRMPRWRTKTEDVLEYQLLGHSPRAGAYVMVGDESTEEQHRMHLQEQRLLSAARETSPRTRGTMAAYIDGTKRLLEFTIRRRLAGTVQEIFGALVGIGLLVFGFTLLLQMHDPWRAVGLAVGLFGAAVIVFVRSDFGKRRPLFPPALPPVGGPTPLVDE